MNRLIFSLIFFMLISFSVVAQVTGVGGGSGEHALQGRFSPQEIENLRLGAIELSARRDQVHQLRANFEANRDMLDSSHEVMIRMLVDGVDLEAFGVREITLKDGTVMSIEELKELAKAKFE